MDPKKLDRIISIIKEQMVANAPGGSGGFGGQSDAKGPTAGFDPVMKLKRRFFKGKRKQWLDYLKNK